jgi:hypothetical protein
MIQVPARSEGREAMEESLTRAERVRRQLKAGRPRKTRTAPRSVFDAVQRIIGEGDRAQGLMLKYGLDPRGIRLTLLYRLADAAIGSKPLPPPEHIGAFITELEQIAAQARVNFLGILWGQVDLEARAKREPEWTMWVTEFADDKRATLDMLAFKNKLASVSVNAEMRALLGHDTRPEHFN